MQWKFLDWLRKTVDDVQTQLKSTDQEDYKDLRESGRAPLSETAKHVRNIEITTKKHTDALLSGQYKSRFRGQGMQFADVRTYQYGDDVRHIDWRSTARSQQVYVKTYEEERELCLFLAVDISASNSFGSEQHNKKESLAIALAAIALSAAKNRDRVGLLLFTDQVELFVPPKKGRKHALRIIDEILGFNPPIKKQIFRPHSRR